MPSAALLPVKAFSRAKARLADGTELRAPTVVSALDPRRTFTEVLLDRIGRRQQRRRQRHQHDQTDDQRPDRREGAAAQPDEG